MRVFVTGVTGGIGSAAVEKLLEQNFTVACLVRDESIVLDKRITKIKGDLLDIPAIAPALNEFRPETLIHLAWIGVDQKEKSNPNQIHNLQAATDLLTLGKQCGVKNFIGMGSESEYGIHNRKIDETAKTLPISKYAITKLATGLLCEKLCHDLDIKYVWLRLFSSYGPNDRAGSLMSTLIKTLLAGKPMSLSKCEQVWDYVYVRDIADLICLIAKDVKATGVFNLGGGNARPLKESVLKISELINLGSELKFGEIPYGPTTNMHLEAEISKLKNSYGWNPKTSLEEGLRQTISWHKSQIV
jgi:UDP-glucose 4-epimerase